MERYKGQPRRQVIKEDKQGGKMEKSQEGAEGSQDERYQKRARRRTRRQ